MENLYSRIKPEIMAKINEERIKYPYTFEQIEFDLKNTNYTLDLKYITVVTLYTHDIIENTNLHILLNIFDNK